MWRRGVFIIIGVALVGAGCGGSSKTTSAAAPASSCTAAVPKGAVATIDTNFGCIVVALDNMDVAQKIDGLAPASGDGPPTQKVTMTKVTITGA